MKSWMEGWCRRLWRPRLAMEGSGIWSRIWWRNTAWWVHTWLFSGYEYADLKFVGPANPLPRLPQCYELQHHGLTHYHQAARRRPRAPTSSQQKYRPQIHARQCQGQDDARNPPYPDYHARSTPKP